MLTSALARHWGVSVSEMSYLPVGFGSHHWEVVDSTGARWFVTADDLETKRRSADEPLDTAYERLRAALVTASRLRDGGRRFVVAPVHTGEGEPLARPADRFAVALYPLVDGRSFSWGQFATPAHRHAILDLVIAIHSAPRHEHAVADDFWIPHRDELVASLDSDVDVVDCGPYARPAAALMAAHAKPIRRLLARYDALADEGRAGLSRAVLTHGEPHPGNSMLTSDGWLLIDWDTALVAPPERDLWSLDPGDGSVLGSYANATGVSLMPSMLELYRIRWDLADLAVIVSGFRKPHRGTPDDNKSWEILRSLVTYISDQPAPVSR
jgi:hypothetical protein